MDEVSQALHLRQIQLSIEECSRMDRICGSLILKENVGWTDKHSLGHQQCLKISHSLYKCAVKADHALK